MASVFKRPKSKYWHAGWRSATGQFRLRSTKQTDRSKALTTALEWERVDKKLGRGEIVEGQVRQVINDILSKVGEPVIEVPSIQKWLMDWVADTEATKSEGTAQRYRGVIEGFLRSIGDRATKPLTALTPAN